MAAVTRGQKVSFHLFSGLRRHSVKGVTLWWFLKEERISTWAEVADKEKSHLCHLFPMAFDKVSPVCLQKIAHLYPYIVDLYVALN